MTCFSRCFSLEQLRRGPPSLEVGMQKCIITSSKMQAHRSPTTPALAAPPLLKPSSWLTVALRARGVDAGGLHPEEQEKAVPAAPPAGGGESGVWVLDERQAVRATAGSCSCSLSCAHPRWQLNDQHMHLAHVPC